jgi:hypothetical protein
MKTDNSNYGTRDTATVVNDKRASENGKVVKSKSEINASNTALVPDKEAKTLEVEIVKLNVNDSCHKMSFFHNDLKYFHNDSLYCELLYKLKEVEQAAKTVSSEGDYVSMMIDDRPQGSMNYYQIALYKIRAKLDKMDRIDSYRINIKSKLIEKHDVVKDKWVAVN